MKLLSSILRRMLRMCPAAWELLLRCLQLCVVLLLCAWLFLLRADGDLVRNLDDYMTALSLNEAAEVVLLVAVLAPVILEDLHREGSSDRPDR